MGDIWQNEFLRSLVLILAGAASIITSIGIINAKFVAPFIAKPIAKALRRELTETIEAIIISDQILFQFNEEIQEAVVAETRVIIDELSNIRMKVSQIDQRLLSLEHLQIQLHAENMRKIDGKESPKNQGK